MNGFSIELTNPVAPDRFWSAKIKAFYTLEIEMNLRKLIGNIRVSEVDLGRNTGTLKRDEVDNIIFEKEIIFGDLE